MPSFCMRIIHFFYSEGEICITHLLMNLILNKNRNTFIYLHTILADVGICVKNMHVNVETTYLSITAFKIKSKQCEIKSLHFILIVCL